MFRNFHQALDDLRSALRPHPRQTGARPDGSGVETAPDITRPPRVEHDQVLRRRRARVYAVPGDEAPPAVPRRRRLRRALPLSGAVVALLAVVVWRQGLLPVSEPADPEVVATYQGGVVTRDHLKQQLAELPDEEQALYRSVEGLQALIGDRVLHEVTRQWAEERQVDQQESFQEAMKHVTEEIQIDDVADQLHEGKIPVGEAELQAYYDANREQFGEQPLIEVKDQIRQVLVEQKEQDYVTNYLNDLKERASLQVDYSLLEVPEPTEAELQRYYQANRTRFNVPEQLTIAQIQVSISLAGGDEAAKARAETARARAAAGEDFATLAQELSDGPERAQGGVIEQPIALGSRGPEFDVAVAPLKPGELSAVFKAGDSYYVVKLKQRDAAQQRSFAEARDDIVATLRAERETQLYAERANRTLFTIHSRRTTLGEFVQELGELPPETQPVAGDVAGKRAILDSLIERLLVVEDAAEQATDVKRQGEIDQTRSDLLARVLHQEEVDEKIAITDEQVRAAYDREPARYAEPARVKVRFLRVGRGLSEDEDRQARARIDEAAARLSPGSWFNRREGADFAEIAKQYGDDGAATADVEQWIGESDDTYIETFEHPLHEMLLPLKVGDISPVLPLADSYYLFQIREKQEVRQRSFEEASELVRQDLEAQQHEERTRAMQDELLSRMQLRVVDRRLRQLLNELGGPSNGQPSAPAE